MGTLMCLLLGLPPPPSIPRAPHLSPTALYMESACLGWVEPFGPGSRGQLSRTEAGGLWCLLRRKGDRNLGHQQGRRGA